MNKSFGSFQFSFKVSDGSLYSNTATSTIVINPSNEARLTTDRHYESPEDVELKKIAEASDIDNDLLNYSIHTPPNNAQVTISSQNGNCE